MSALQRALTVARGTFLARFDPEDISDPERLRVQVDFLRHNPEVGVVGSQANLIDSRDGIVGYANVLNSESYLDRAIYLFNPVLPQTSMLRRAVVEQCGGYRPGLSEDYDLIARIATAGTRIVNLPLALVSYRLNPVGRCPDLPSLLLDCQPDQFTGTSVQKRAVLRGNLRVKRRHFSERFRLIDRLYDCYEHVLLTIPRDWMPSAERFARGVLDWLVTAMTRRTRRQFARDGQASAPGIASPVQLRPGTSDVQVFQQVLGQCEYAFQLPADPDTIVDAGANIGLTSVYFANRFPRSQILAIEPDPNNFRTLQKNSEPYPNITPINAALWPLDEPIYMDHSAVDPWAFRVHSIPPSESDTVNSLVRCVTMKRLMTEFGIERLDLLKLDVEGAEKHLLDAPSGWLEKVNALMVETHDRFLPGCTHSVLRAMREFSLVATRGEVALFVRSDGRFSCAATPSEAAD